MEKFLVGDAECRGDPIYYYLLVETARDETKVYGAAVEYRGEAAELPAVSLSRRSAMSLLEQLRRGRVTPVTAPDVAADWRMK